MSFRAAIVGNGMMGSTVAVVWRERGHEVVATVERGGSIEQVRGADVAFEFTVPEAAAENVERLLGLVVPTVCGTTGWDVAAAKNLARELEVPLLVAPNFSIGVAVLRAALGEASRRLAAFPEFEPGIVERHHARKRDSPSGTARMLAGVIAETGGAEPRVVALRQGGQPGEHRILFEGDEECLELVHRVRSRRVFAIGAVRAAEWLVGSGVRGPVEFEDFMERKAT